MKKHLMAAAVAAVAAITPLHMQAQAVDLTSDPDVVAAGETVSGKLADLFDNNTSTKASLAKGASVTWRCKAPYTIQSYSLTGGNSSAGNPQQWTLEGSNDLEQWSLIDKKLRQPVKADKESVYTVAEAKRLPYRYFRITLEAAQGGADQCSLSELHLLGEKGALPAAPSDLRLRPTSEGMETAWRDNALNEDGYLLQRSLDGTQWSNVATLQANATSFTDRNVPAGVGAIYRVAACMGSVLSDFCSSGAVATGNVSALTDVAANRSYSADGTNPIHDNENGPKGADGNIFTKYLSTRLPATLTITLNTPVAVSEYAITSANDAPERDPRRWVVEASRDGAVWTTIDTKENQSFNARFQTYRYRTGNNQAYSHYRITVTEVNGTGYMQLAEFALFADIEPQQQQAALLPPADLRINVRSYNQMELLWTDNNTGEDGYVIERSTDGINWNRRYLTRPNDQKCYPYSLRPNTTYHYRIAARKGEQTSEWSPVVSATTPSDQWPDSWPNFNFDNGYHTGNLVRKYSNDDIAIFVNPEDVNAEGVSLADLDLSWMIEPYTKMWVAIRDTFKDEYGEYLLGADKLYIVPHYHADGGGLGRLFNYRDADQLYRNIVHVSVGKNSGWRLERNPGNGSCNFLYDVVTHEVGHIVEGTASGKKDSPFYPVWLDSKWAEILQYDIFGKMDPAHQQVWHNEYMRPGVHQESKPAPGSEWYIGFFYPTYAAYGGDQLLRRFFALLGEHYFQRDGVLQGNGTLGELVHFWSGAAGYDVTPFAKAAFGWNDEFELQLLEARNRYPMVTYQPAPANRNLLRNPGAVLTTNATGSTTLNRINDGNESTSFDSASKGGALDWVEVTYHAKDNSSAVESLRIVAAGLANSRPQAIELLGSNDAEQWQSILSVDAPQFAGNIFEATLPQPACHTYFKVRMKALRNRGVSLIVNELELYGQLTPATPSALRGLWDGTAVQLSWGGPYKDLDKFEIERAQEGEEYRKIGETDIMNLSFTDDEALGNRTYLYRVRATGENSVTAYSNELRLFTGETGLQAVATDPASIAAMLNIYSRNRVEIYTLAGSRIISEAMSGDRWRALCSAGVLPPGIYIANISFGTAAPAICTKIAVK